MSEAAPPIRARALAAALPDLLMGFVFLTAWVRPDLLGDRPVPWLVLVMLLEFIVVHSGGFAGGVALGELPTRRKVLTLGGVGLFYTLFVGGFALAFRTWWPLVSFWALMLNRMASVLFGQGDPGDERALAQRGWAAGALFYLGFAMLTVLPPVPRFGLTPEVVAAQHLEGGGLWIDQPWRAMAFGFLYFTAVGLSELHDHRWFAGGIPARGRSAA